ncbi:hypothetical protein [Gloeocapsa sp. PCC 73106]|uniref:hypothetical protein n=1 Tax=Gloeocapsa sp. PCC 73106 TaxID=102232 RepID=UPI0002AD06DC|nr:hypothetical protein [Gloeocapsa sp. PCC 73106]ELR98087.1 Ribbon-helix-helix protein, copG family [Gloeocapsa sp. PCC 73106]
MSSVSVGIRIPSNLYEKLINHAHKVDTSKSEIVISALAKYLDATEDVPLSVKVANLEKRVIALEVTTYS